MDPTEWHHVTYPKMIEKLEALGLDDRAMRATRNARFVAREKIHGANVAAHTDGASVRFARRKSWIDDLDGFFAARELFAVLESKLLALHAESGARAGERVVLYGELFGGRYPHPAVVAIEGVEPVQGGVWYSPALEFSAFDMAFVRDRGGATSLEFMGAKELDVLCASVLIDTAPVLAAGRLSDALAVALPFATRVPAKLGLPPIEANFAEGIVVTPRDRASGALADAPRVVLKRKSESFSERGGDPLSELTQRGQPYAALYGLVNQRRVEAAWSKVGHARMSESSLVDLLVAEVTGDVIAEWLEQRPHLAHLAHDRSEPIVTLRAVVDRAVRAFLRARRP